MVSRGKRLIGESRGLKISSVIPVAIAKLLRSTDFSNRKKGWCALWNVRDTLDLGQRALAGALGLVPVHGDGVHSTAAYTPPVTATPVATATVHRRRAGRGAWARTRGSTHSPVTRASERAPAARP